MDSDAVLKKIERQAELADRQQAEDVTQAVLSVLGERLKGGETSDLAAQLPGELADALPLSGAGEVFGVEEFDRRVAEREGGSCGLAEAHRHSAAVLGTVLSAVSQGERRDVAAQLPAEYRDFLPADALGEPSGP